MISKLANLKSIHIRHASILMAGTLLAQFVNFFSSPILTRLFTPEQFGYFSLFTSFVGPLTILSTLRLETAMVIAQAPAEKWLLRAFLYRLCLFTALAIAGVLGLAYVVPGIQLEAWYALIPLGLYMSSVMLVENAEKNFAKDYSKIAIAKIVQAGTMALVAILFGYYLNVPEALILASLVALVGAWLFLYLPAQKCTVDLRSEALKGPVLKRYSRYLHFTMPASLLDTVSQQIPVFILSYYASKEMAGHYGLALKVLILPTHIIGGSVAQVFLRRFSELWVEPGARLRFQLAKTWVVLLVLGLVPYGLLYLFGEELFSIVFGANWAQAGQLASLIAPMLFVNFISGPSSSAILLENQHVMGLYFGAIAFVSRSVALFYGVYVGDVLLGFKLWVVFEILTMALNNAVIWRHVSGHERRMAP